MFTKHYLIRVINNTTGVYFYTKCTDPVQQIKVIKQDIIDQNNEDVIGFTINTTTFETYEVIVENQSFLNYDYKEIEKNIIMSALTER
jgi:hypothetical protein